MMVAPTRRHADMPNDYVVKVVSFAGRASAEVSVKGASPMSQRIRIRPDAILDVAALLIECHAALVTIDAPDPLAVALAPWRDTEAGL